MKTARGFNARFNAGDRNDERASPKGMTETFDS